MFSQGIRAISPQAPPPPQVRVLEDCAGSMLLVSQRKLLSCSYRAIGGIAAILSQIAVESDTKSRRKHSPANMGCTRRGSYSAKGHLSAF